MSNVEANSEESNDPNEQFYLKAQNALKDLFERAQAAHELHFAMALMPEFRGAQDAGWSTAHEAVRAYDEFEKLIKSLDRKEPIRVRVILAFYVHVAEGSGFYEIPKKLLLTIEGRGNNMFPFQDLVERHRLTGEAMAPNANRIMKDMMGHASELGLHELAEVFREPLTPTLETQSRTPTISFGTMGSEFVVGMEDCRVQFPGPNSMHWSRED